MDYLAMESEGNRILMRLLNRYLRKGMRIAEVGCGTADFLMELERKYGVEGICIDPYGYGEKVINIPAEDIHSIGESFDLIYLIRTLHHLNVARFSKSSYESLRHGGYLVIVDWKKGTDTGVPERYLSLEETLNIFGKFATVESGEGIWNFYAVFRKISSSGN